MNIRQCLLNIRMTLAAFLLFANMAIGQSLLNKTVSLEANRKPLAELMRSMEKQGGFLFSYNTVILKKDSLVTISARNKTVRQVLEMLFDGKYEYKETGNYIILQRGSSGQFWYVSGYVVDEKTGQHLANASIYEPQQLVAALSNDRGYFRLKLKGKYAATTINVSKELYTDRSVPVDPGTDQELTVSIAPRYVELDPVVVSQYTRIAQTWCGRMFMSSRG